MGVSGILDIGSSALAAQMAAINVTGENIANANTAGYSRQTPLLETAPSNSGQFPSVGNGVTLTSVQRSYDQFLQKQINTQIGATGEQSTLQTALQRIEPLFGDLASSGIGTALQDFYGSWQDLAMNPQGAAERQAVLGKAQALVDTFHQVSDGLQQVKQDANQSLAAMTGDITGKAKQIADLNLKIRAAGQDGGSANQLRDSRDQLIQALAKEVGISTVNNADGTVSVGLARGPLLVDGTSAASLSVKQEQGTGGLSSIMFTPAGGGGSTDITPILTEPDGKSGELGGALNVRDQLVNAFQAQLDELAGTLANQVNGAHSTGYGLNGSTGINLFTPPPAAPYAGYSGTIAMNVTNTDDIAASSTDPTQPGGGSGNNVNALAIADKENVAVPMSSGAATLTGFYSSLLGTVGMAVQATNQDAAHGTAMFTQLQTQRDSASGVSLDEELANLTQFQKAYQGAAQLITTGEQLMDTILGMVGQVQAGG